ncbi:hypothetical protein B5F82_04060 [Megamonas hypermegale]|uniref:restriction endonuclease n=1 Tax=Megamonas hypermegale TaxID=158847 RepID=UPI000B3B0899|nr:restriction endonuclease [Megamonas hypermegale]MBM6760650.1 restriction endonuclease [Megamonas hypermegale]OUO40604.1 hypothetical protein B5F82_04060 [Megamonas hypermegale]
MKKLFLLIFIILTLYINTVFAETIKAPNMASYNNDYIELETTDNINYLKYIDPKYKYSILIPKKYDKITYYDLTGTCIFEKDYTTHITTEVRNNFLKENVTKLYQEDTKFINKEDIAYTDSGDNWYVISWSDISSINYKKVFVNNNYITTLEFVAPKKNKGNYADITTTLEASFSPAKEDIQPNKEILPKNASNPTNNTISQVENSSQNQKSDETPSTNIPEKVNTDDNSSSANNTIHNKPANYSNLWICIIFCSIVCITFIYFLLKKDKSSILPDDFPKNYIIPNVWLEDCEPPLNKYLITNREISTISQKTNKIYKFPQLTIFKLINTNIRTTPVNYPIKVIDKDYLLLRGFNYNIKNGDFIYICCYRGKGLYYALYKQKLIIIPAHGIKGLNKPYTENIYKDNLKNWAKYQGKEQNIHYDVMISIVPLQATSLTQSYWTKYLINFFLKKNNSIFFNDKDSAIQYKNDIIKQLNYLYKQKLQQQNNNKQARSSFSHLYTLKDIDNLKGWYDFEIFVAKIFEQNGYYVYHTRKTNDGGKDIIVEKNNIKIYIECKYWNAHNAIGREAIQKLVGAAIMDGVQNAIFITTSGYNQNAITAANMINRQDNFKIELWGKQKLIDFANKNI